KNEERSCLHTTEPIAKKRPTCRATKNSAPQQPVRLFPLALQRQVGKRNACHQRSLTARGPFTITAQRPVRCHWPLSLGTSNGCPRRRCFSLDCVYSRAFFLGLFLACIYHHIQWRRTGVRQCWLLSTCLP
ncbi:unnamed protein product, partial [Ectocarpus sp. 12 AP-2014]